MLSTYPYLYPEQPIPNVDGGKPSALTPACFVQARVDLQHAERNVDSASGVPGAASLPYSCRQIDQRWPPDLHSVGHCESAVSPSRRCAVASGAINSSLKGTVFAGLRPVLSASRASRYDNNYYIMLVGLSNYRPHSIFLGVVWERTSKQYSNYQSACCAHCCGNLSRTSCKLESFNANNYFVIKSSFCMGNGIQCIL